jgi:PAS domain S-box-containing protein
VKARIRRWLRWPAHRTASSEIILVLGLTLLAFCLSSIFNLYERFTTQTRHLEAWQIDELPVALLAFSLCSVWLIARRVRALRVEIVQRQQMAKALQESEAHYRALVEGSIQGIFIHCDGIVLFANQPLARLFGYNSPDALVGQKLWQLVAPHERVRLEGYHHAHVQGDAAPSRYEWQGRHQDGTLIWLASLISSLPWNGQAALLTTVVDITEHKWQEQVQQQMAYELHDGIAQLLVSAQQHLETFHDLQQGQAILAQRHLDLGRDRLQRAIVETRRLMARLRPVPLEALGLIPAVQQYLEELQQEAGWAVEYSLEIGCLHLPAEWETALFRIIQEAVTNARKHANTPRLSVELKINGVLGHTLSVVIRDWGTGFQPEHALSSPQHFGLLGMRERARMLGGTWTIESRPGQGTIVCVQIPLPPREGE